MTAMLTLAAVERRFSEVVAVDGLDLSVERGEVVGLLGHNGAGKTTIVRLLAGLLTPTAGHVAVDGRDPVAEGPAVRRRLGVLPASSVLDGRMTAADNLRFVAELHGLPPDEIDGRVHRALDQFGLGGRADAEVADLSTGLRQRLSLARVLLPDPDVLLLDEPTSAMDPVAARQVRSLVADLARGEDRTVLLCTHDLAEAELLCDRVVVLRHGRVVTTGSPAELTAGHGVGRLVLEVAEDQVPAALDVLDAAGVTSVDREAAGRLRLTGVPRHEVPALVSRLAAADVSVFEVRRQDPTLEDVYLALHERGGHTSTTEEVPS